MCILCNISYKNKQSNQQSNQQYFEKILNKNNYNNINNTSINIILYGCIGIYGNNIKEISINGIKDFIKWLNIQELSDTYDKSLYNSNVLLKLVEWCELYENDNNLDKNELLDVLYDKFEEFNNKKMCMFDILITGSIFGLLSYKCKINK